MRRCNVFADVKVINSESINLAAGEINLILVFTFETEEERDKFDYIYRKYKNLLFYKAWDILHDHMLAEDAVSEAYIRIYHNLDKIEDPDSPRSIAFIATIVRNVALTIRSQGKSDVTDNIENFEEVIADQNDMEENILSEMASEKLVLIIRKLDEQSQNIFLMKYAYDLPHKEIAEQMNITENYVTVKLYRIKKQLAKLVAMEA